MKKSLLALGLTLSIVLAMATPAFAAGNANGDGTTDVTKPGATGSAQVAGESFNAATITNKAGVTTPTATDWEVLNDDDAKAAVADVAADINVWAKVVDGGTKVYKVDLAWGAMKFQFDSGSGKWNTTSHTYDTTGGGTPAWTVGYLDGINNKVAITNHSNNAINAGFVFAMDGTTFNGAGSTHNVVGNFFDTNTKAATAAKVLTGTFSDALGNLNPSAVKDKLAGPVKLATADAYNDGTTNQPLGARTDDVFFAFSGSPDKDMGATLDTFKKVGTITVTVTPNDEANLNQPAVTVP